MQAHLERQRRAQAAVKPHAEHREAERRLREVVLRVRPRRLFIFAERGGKDRTDARRHVVAV